MTAIYLLLWIALLFIVYFILTRNTHSKEGFIGLSGSTQEACPDLLVQKGTTLYLVNTKKPKIPGVNPIQFSNLEEYTEYVDWQRSRGIRCPVLFLQHSYDTQGNPAYRVRPSPYDLQGGLPPTRTVSGSKPNPPNQPNPSSLIPPGPNPTLLIDATRNDDPYNTNSLPGFDQSSQYVGATTPLDSVTDSQNALSPNPMDANWGGNNYTQNLIDQGYYKGNEVSVYVP
jgi:hypothetical protein